VAIARAAAASAVALFPVGLFGYSVVVVVRASTWPLRRPLGQLVDLTGLEGVSGWDWNGVFDTLAALAASLMVEGVVALTLIGLLLLLLLDLFGLIGFVPNWVVDTVDTSVSSRCHSARAVGFAIAVFLV
jgi:hypothetical protein